MLDRTELPPFDYEAFAHGVRGMPREEVGDYIRLLCAMYDAGGSLENDPEKLRVVLECYATGAASRVAALIKRGKLYVGTAGRLHNRRIDIEIAELSEKRSGIVNSNRARIDLELTPNTTRTAQNSTKNAMKTVNAPAKQAAKKAVDPLPSSSPPKKVSPHPFQESPPLTPPDPPSPTRFARGAPSTPPKKPGLVDSLFTERELRQAGPDPVAADQDAEPISRFSTKVGDVRSVLTPTLSLEVANAVIEHRKRMKKPLTVNAARMLVKEYRQAPTMLDMTPDAAASHQIDKVWQGFECEWVLRDRTEAARPLGRNGHHRQPTMLEEHVVEMKRKYVNGNTAAAPASDGEDFSAFAQRLASGGRR